MVDPRCPTAERGEPHRDLLQAAETARWLGERVEVALRLDGRARREGTDGVTQSAE
jgi:hypothetical protein